MIHQLTDVQTQNISKNINGWKFIKNMVLLLNS